MKTRIVHTRIWEDDFFVRLNRPSKLLFLYLLTNSRVNLSGMYELPDRIIMFDTGLNTAELEEAKQALQPKARFYQGWVYLPNAQKLNGFVGEKNEKAINRELKSIPENINNFLTTGYPTDTLSDISDAPSIGYMGVSATSDTPINHKSEIINHKSKTINHKTTNKQENEVESSNIARILEAFNKSQGTKFTSARSFESNLSHWIREYSVEDIIQAIQKIKDHPYWQDKDVDPAWLFRRQNQQGEPVDYIGQLLNTKRKEVIVL